MLRSTLLIAFILISLGNYGQLSVTATGTNFTIDFDATVANVNNGTYTGSGFVVAPGAGNLDADAWATSGMSDGAKAFGAANTTGDHARGTSTGGVTTGGIYGFDHGGGNIAIGWQPGGSDATPGSITLEFVNNTGVTITSLDVSYDVWEYNDQGRANDIRFSHDATGTNGSGDLGTLEGAVTHTTVQAAGAGSWVQSAKSVTIGGLSIGNGTSYYLRWATDDVSGSGSRDEFGIDDIVINATACTLASEPTTDASASVFSNVGCGSLDLSWTNGNGANRIVVMSTSPIAGTPTDGTNYTANADFGSGATIAAGEFVVYNGAGTSVSITGLAGSTTYHIAVFEYNGVSANCNENYLVSSPHTNSQATLACPYGLTINEVYVNTVVNDGAPNPDTGEWIEFYNEGSAAVDVSCWAFSDGDFTVTFPSGTVIAGHDYFLVGSATGVACGGCDFPGQAMDLDWATSGCSSGGTIGTFTNGAEQVVLFDESGNVIDAVEWGGGQALPASLASVTGCGCSSQTLNLPAMGATYESMGASVDGTSFERSVDASLTWTTESSPTIDASNGAALPVSLLSFTGEKENGNHVLKWTTGSEVNNAAFEVWRGVDGIRYEFLGSTEGSGTSTQVNQYSLKDYNPQKGINYYKLHQIDYDGKRTKYQAITLNSENDQLTIDSWIINGNRAEIKLDGFTERVPLQVELLDITGKRVYSQSHSPGSNLYLNNLDLSSGLFILSIRQRNQRVIEKIKF